MGLGLRAAARELGTSHVALLKADRTGRLGDGKLPDGSYDVERCRAALGRNSHPVKAKAGQAQRKPVPAKDAPEVARESPTPVTVKTEAPIPDVQADLIAPATGSIAEAARQLEWEKLREKRLKVDREEGRLVDIAAVNAWVAGMIIKARDLLLRIGPEARDDLARQMDPIECERIVRDKVNEALEQLAQFNSV